MEENKIHYLYYLLNFLFIVLYIMSYFGVINHSPIDLDVFKYNDRQHSWKYCHKCGKEFGTTVSNPLCDVCDENK